MDLLQVLNLIYCQIDFFFFFLYVLFLGKGVRTSKIKELMLTTKFQDTFYMIGHWVPFRLKDSNNNFSIVTKKKNKKNNLSVCLTSKYFWWHTMSQSYLFIYLIWPTFNQVSQLRTPDGQHINNWQSNIKL